LTRPRTMSKLVRQRCVTPNPDRRPRTTGTGRPALKTVAL
jgi:hypothetical protein